jgi:thiol:disulfide interchange protein DsbC
MPFPLIARMPRVAAALSLSIVASIALAQTSDTSGPPMSRPPGASTGVGTQVLDTVVRKNLETRLGATVDSITRLPLAGLYEVRVGEDIFYSDPTGNYILVGNLIDLRTSENLTRTRVAAMREASLPPFKFAELPLDDAVKVVKGSGKRKVAIFEDPNCGYCKKLEKAILEVGDVTIYVFLYPVLGPDSLVKSKQVWCSADRAKAWNEWMHSATALAGDGKCATPLDKTLQLGKKLKVEGTPTLFFSNNKRVEGTVDADDLERLLAG